MSVIVWVDPRVGSKELLPLIRKQGVQAELATLDSADFAFTINGPEGEAMVGVERKTLPDLIASVQSGRLQGMVTESSAGQLPRLRECYEYPFLLVEGEWLTDQHGVLVERRKHGSPRPLPGRMSADTLNKRLFSIVLQGGLWLWQTTTREQSARWIASLARWGNDQLWDGHTTLQTTHKVRSFVPLSRFRERAMALPGVGLAASKALESYFAGSELRLLNTNAKELSDIAVGSAAGPKRFGAAKAERVIEALRALR